MDVGKVGLLLLKIGPLLMTLFFRWLSSSYQEKWRDIKPSSMTSERRSESQDFLEWSIFVRDWLESRNFLAGSGLYAFFLFLWYLLEALLSEQEIATQIFLLYIALTVLTVAVFLLSSLHTRNFYQNSEQHDYYGKYYDEDEDSPSLRTLLTWPRVYTYFIDFLVIVAIVCVELLIRT